MGISVDKEIIGPVKLLLLICEKWPYNLQKLQFVLPDTARSILGYHSSATQKVTEINTLDQIT